MSANILTAYPRLIRLGGFLMALGFAGITLWNTYRLIQRIEDDEKQQMELWGLAQQKLASNKDGHVDNNQVLDNVWNISHGVKKRSISCAVSILNVGFPSGLRSGSLQAKSLYINSICSCVAMV